jgi:hypothetical protein
MFNIKHDFGSPISIYTKAVECSPEVFGFINSYYSPSIIQRKRAYTRALFLNRLENIKKIKGIDTKTLNDLKNYVEKMPSVSDSLKNRVKMDYKNSKSSKDTSPEDFLKKKQKYYVDKKLKTMRFKSSFDL